MYKWRKKDFWPLIEKSKLAMDYINNANQTGLIYLKFPKH